MHVFVGLLIADEPTTGLDANSAIDVVRAMRDGAEAATTICTIHQPSSELFHMFDDICLMAEGGRVAYLGPVASSGYYFISIGLRCPANFNPADFYINCLAVKHDSLATSTEAIDHLCDQFQDRFEKAILSENGCVLVV